MLQSLKMLALPILELEAYIKQELVNNPLLELREEKDEEDLEKPIMRLPIRNRPPLSRKARLVMKNARPLVRPKSLPRSWINGMIITSPMTGLCRGRCGAN
jgi:DNA-directed RNA polymerase specialized sigma54-like protein